MKNSVALLCMSVSLCAAPAFADEAEDRQAVVATVQAFFDAMTARDAAGMRSTLMPDGVLHGYREDEGGLSLITRTHRQYMDGLADGSQRLVERFWEPQVLLHGRMALVWTPYDFYVDGDFSHCGIDNFSLLRTDEGWKISGIVFSMETEDCPASPLGPLRE